MGELPQGLRKLLHFPYFQLIWSLCWRHTNFQSLCCYSYGAQTQEKLDFCQIRFFVRELPLDFGKLLHLIHSHHNWSLCWWHTNFQYPTCHTYRAQTQKSHDFCQIRFFVRELPLDLRMLLLLPYFHPKWSLCWPLPNFKHSSTHTFWAQTQNLFDFCQIRFFVGELPPRLRLIVYWPYFRPE